MPKVLLITSIQVDCIIFDEFGQVCSNYPGKFAICRHLKSKVRNEIQDLTGDFRKKYSTMDEFNMK